MASTLPRPVVGTLILLVILGSAVVVKSQEPKMVGDSCGPDDTCVNNATCVSDSCACDTGFKEVTDTKMCIAGSSGEGDNSTTAANTPEPAGAATTTTPEAEAAASTTDSGADRMLFSSLPALLFSLLLVLLRYS